MADADLLELNQQCVTNLFMCLGNVTKYLEDESETRNLIMKLKKCVEGYCLIEAKHKVANKALGSAKSETDSSNIDNLQERFKDHLNSLTSKGQNHTNHGYMTEFNKRVAEYTNRKNLDDSDLAITQSDDHFIDPITKKQIENPVKNKNCGHIYDQKSIIQYINMMKFKSICPVAGCSYSKPVTKDDLVIDDEFRFRMAITHHSTLAQNSIIECDD